MNSEWKLKFAGLLLLCVGLSSTGWAGQANAPQTQNQGAQTQIKRKIRTKKALKAQQKPPLPPLPSGPTGPVQQIPLDSMTPVPPQVTYENTQLTIVANNSTLGDILRAVRKQTGAEIEIPAAPDRVVTHLGPGSARDVIAELLNGSRFNYVLLGSPADNAVLTRVVLVAKSAQDSANPANPNVPTIADQQQPGVVRHSGNPGMMPPDPEANAAEADDDNDVPPGQPPAEAEQPPAPVSPDQSAVKTPQQMLQEMQQRQLQLQQQQQQGQQPAPPPPRPPQD